MQKGDVGGMKKVTVFSDVTLLVMYIHKKRNRRVEEFHTAALFILLFENRSQIQRASLSSFPSCSASREIMAEFVGLGMGPSV